VFDEFFEQDTWTKLNENFLDSNTILKWPNYMGGRRLLNNENPDFYKFLNSNEIWKNVYKYLNSFELYRELISRFSEYIEKYGPNNDFNNLNYVEDYYLNKSKFYGKYFEISSKDVCNSSSKELLYTILKRKMIQCTSLSERFERRIFKKNRVAFNMDISAAREGYSREIHRDSDGRVLVILVFLDDYEGSIGGDFLTYRNKDVDSIPFDQMPAQPNERDVQIAKRYKPKKNTGIIFLSTPNSYHGVEMIEYSKDWRKFFYGAYTCIDNKAWNNNSHFNLSNY
jgi:hypothetical protein